MKDYLDELIDENLASDPEFAAAWPAFDIGLHLVKLRLDLGLTQQQVADRMRVRRERVAMIEAHPDRTSFGAVIHYASVLGAQIKFQAPHVLAQAAKREKKPGRKPSSKKVVARKAA